MGISGHVLIFLLLNALTWPAMSTPLTTIDAVDNAPAPQTVYSKLKENNESSKIISPITKKNDIIKTTAATNVTTLETLDNETITKSAPDSSTDERTTILDYATSDAMNLTTTDNYDYIDDEDEDGTLKEDIVTKFEKLAIFKDFMYVVTYKVVAVVYKFWRVIVDIVWKPLLKLYISPLRLIHTYLLPELINFECFQVYHSDIHIKESPFKPYRPNKLELVKCIFQYIGHYFRSWQFVKRIEDNSYNLI